MNSIRFGFILLLICLLALVSTASASWDIVDTSTGSRTDPLLYYDFDVGDFPTDDALDLSGNGYDGVVTGAVNGTGIRNNGLEFDGINDFVLLADESSGEDQFKTLCDNGCSIGVWADIDVIADEASYLFSKYVASGTERFFYKSEFKKVGIEIL